MFPTASDRDRSERHSHPEAAAYREMFTGPYVHRVILGGVGHNPPQEAPREFADAVLEVDRL